MAHASVRRGQLAGLTAAVLFGCSAPLISTLTGSGSALSIAGLLYAGAGLALLAVRLIQGRAKAETPVQRQDWPALVGLTLLGGVVGRLALVLGLARLPPASSSLLLNLEAVFTLTIAVAVARRETTSTSRRFRHELVRRGTTTWRGPGPRSSP
jgi:drug/metabolite transporter (DMT)-like permease